MQKLKQDRAAYKKHKRRTKNKLILLVGLHTMFMFVFVSLVCFKYLDFKKWDTVQNLDLTSDIFYFCYLICGLMAIKFKNWRMLITMILMLAASFITDIISLIVLTKDSQKIEFIRYFNILMLVASFFVPASLLNLWDQLKDSTWRETFDLITKQNKYLTQTIEESRM